MHLKGSFETHLFRNYLQLVSKNVSLILNDSKKVSLILNVRLQLKIEVLKDIHQCLYVGRFQYKLQVQLCTQIKKYITIIFSSSPFYSDVARRIFKLFNFGCNIAPGKLTVLRKSCTCCTQISGMYSSMEFGCKIAPVEMWYIISFRY